MLTKYTAVELYCFMIAIILIRTQVSQGLRPYAMEFISYNHTYSSKIYKMLSLRLLNNTGSRTVLNGSAFYRIDLKNFNMSVRMTVVDSRRSKPWTILEITLEGCKLIDEFLSPKSLNFLSHAIRNIRSASHFMPKRCPFKKNVEYYFDHFTLDAEQFPSFLPKMKFNVNLRYSIEKFNFYEADLTMAVETVRSKGKQ